MDDARELCSAYKVEESMRLPLIGHHDSRLIYFFTGKGKQSFEEMSYENVWKAGEQSLKGIANHVGKKVHWSDSTMALLEDDSLGDSVGAAAPHLTRRQSRKGAMQVATSAAAAAPPVPVAHLEVVSLADIKNLVWQLEKLGYKKGIVVSKKENGNEKYSVIDSIGGTCVLLRPAIVMGVTEKQQQEACP